MFCILLALSALASTAPKGAPLSALLLKSQINSLSDNPSVVQALWQLYFPLASVEVVQNKHKDGYFYGPHPACTLNDPPRWIYGGADDIYFGDVVVGKGRPCPTPHRIYVAVGMHAMDVYAVQSLASMSQVKRGNVICVLLKHMLGPGKRGPKELIVPPNQAADALREELLTCRLAPAELYARLEEIKTVPLPADTVERLIAECPKTTVPRLTNYTPGVELPFDLQLFKQILINILRMLFCGLLEAGVVTQFQGGEEPDLIFAMIKGHLGIFLPTASVEITPEARGLLSGCPNIRIQHVKEHNLITVRVPLHFCESMIHINIDCMQDNQLNLMYYSLTTTRCYPFESMVPEETKILSDRGYCFSGPILEMYANLTLQQGQDRPFTMPRAIDPDQIVMLACYFAMQHRTNESGHSSEYLLSTLPIELHFAPRFLIGRRVMRIDVTEELILVPTFQLVPPRTPILARIGTVTKDGLRSTGNYWSFINEAFCHVKFILEEEAFVPEFKNFEGITEEYMSAGCALYEYLLKQSST